MEVGDSDTYTLPGYSDEDSADSHTAVATLADGSPLPGFITFDPINMEFDFDPTDNS